MPQTFQRHTELAVKLVLAAIFGGSAVLLLVLVAMARPDVDEAVAQPIPFSHKHHVGDVGLDCRYCHTTVDKAAFAGMPSTHTCLSCHSQLYKNAPLLALLHASAAIGQPVAWTRLHRLPDFVYFDHSVHVGRGVACIECHGRVDQMALTWRTASLEMQWCLACHRAPASHLHPASQVYAMPPSDAGQLDPAALRWLASPAIARRLTDCSTCHR
jgi:hypothetical protein